MNWQALVDEAAQRIARALAENIAGRVSAHTEPTERTTEAPRAICGANNGIAEARRRLYEAHKAAGLCVKCSNKATHGVLCEAHRNDNARRASEEYARIKAIKAPHK